MGLLDRIEARRKPEPRAFSTPSEAPAWSQAHGHRDEFAPVEYGDYIATSNDIFSVANRRARLISSPPIRAYRGNDNDKELLRDDQVSRLLDHVNPFWTFPRLIRMTELSMCLWGEGFWAVERDARGTPTELWWLKPTQCHPVPHPDKWIDGFVYEPTTGGAPIHFAANEVVWFRYPNPLDQYAGLSPVAAARLAADVSSAAMKSNRNLFSQGMQIGGVVSPKGDKVSFSPEQAADLEEMMSRRFKGVDKAHRWMVLRFEAEMKAMSVTNKDAEWMAGMNLSFRQVCRAYGMQAGLLNDLEHATLANVQEFKRLEWEDTLVPELDFYAAELREQLLPMFSRRSSVDHIEFDYSRVPALQKAASDTWERDHQQIVVGAVTINEWRHKHGMPSVAWGDVAWMQDQMRPVESAEDDPGDNPDVPNLTPDQLLSTVTPAATTPPTPPAVEEADE